MAIKHPRVPGFLDDNPSTTRILCPYCGCLHIHGCSPGNRIPHCFNKKDLPEYCIELVRIPVPREALKIDQEARRLHRVLQNRRHSNRITGSSKPDIAYEEEVKGLAAAARSLNEQILTEVAHAE